ncbi:rRNA pseudouridine synthase [Candidatus Woesearchaeota archaeon]|jgi:23S rRNA pseudouridine2605 synthase|nr:rRNA pseudouridine synthase [Candidatus Woesearchaeota archaeon]MBT5272074.1 rRNA pseudouridine synthase [Candidatus Woesearchaeota archaeon]MBT6041824.1 rRNA pseudouridine synthase [Candidatus Woesearchaeota archaeon]MBT6336801.1 rRNA pseudouridine synthase [Candidatus Woesearchaeota archaeon]MBT7927664.1 rRNA pseudouridine synthase [Candidatus Woesearchaeota archaeon]
MPKNTKNTSGKLHRVQKLMSNYGYCSRRKAEEIIQEGRVKVNNKPITIGDKATETDKIYVDGKLVNKERKVYFMFHKPVGCVTALKDDKYRTIMDFIRIKTRVFPIGRLDFNTSGLLLLTNDGDFANKIMHPRYEIKKTYLAGLFNPINDVKIKQIEEGVELNDGKTSPAKVKRLDEKHIEIMIHEGKNRIVRRILKKLDLNARFLKRIRIGKLNLGDLEEGDYQVLTQKEKKLVFESP